MDMLLIYVFVIAVIGVVLVFFPIDRTIRNVLLAIIVIVGLVLLFQYMRGIV